MVANGTRASSASVQGSVLGQSLRVLLVDGLFMPTGLLVAVYLTRRLGSAGYAVFALASMLVAILEMATSTPLAQAVKRAVGRGGDWRGVAAVAIQRQLAVGGVAAVIIWFLARTLEAKTALPGLGMALRLFALDIPLFGLAQLYRALLVGLGRYGAQTLGNVGRMLARPMLTVILVESGFGLSGAILGAIGVSLVHLVLGLGALPASPRPQAHTPLPVAFGIDYWLGLSRLLNERLDLFAVALTGGTIGSALIGIYAASQFLTTLPGAIAAASLSLIGSAIRQFHRAGNQAAAIALAENTLRGSFLVLPFAGLALGAAQELTSFLFGAEYQRGAGPLALLIGAAAVLIVVSSAIAILVANDKGGHALSLSAALPVTTAIGLMILMPYLGMMGASLAALSSAALIACLALLSVRCNTRVRVPWPTLRRCGCLAVAAAALARLWPLPALLFPAKLAIITLSLGVVLVAWKDVGISLNRREG